MKYVILFIIFSLNCKAQGAVNPRYKNFCGNTQQTKQQMMQRQALMQRQLQLRRQFLIRMHSLNQQQKRNRIVIRRSYRTKK